jgi:hypothetical protein
MIFLNPEFYVGTAEVVCMILVVYGSPYVQILKVQRWYQALIVAENFLRYRTTSLETTTGPYQQSKAMS